MQLNENSIKIPDILKLSLVNNSNRVLMIFSHVKFKISFFLVVPSSIKFQLKKDKFISFFSFNSDELNNFIFTLNKKLTFLRFPFFCKLFLKGLGFKIKHSIIGNEKFLELKLGFSQLIFLKIPFDTMAVTVKKTAIILSGFCKVDIGNFANQIYNLRKPNVYTGKGFRYKNQRLRLKDVKKT